jgi:hypothetical protein
MPFNEKLGINMKSLIFAIAFSLTTAFPLASYAGPGDSCHFHGSKPAAEATITQCANQRKDALVKNGKLEKSWSPIKQESVEYIDGKKGKEWKVIFINPSASDQNKKNLFMFFTPPGNFIAANYTGQ